MVLRVQQMRALWPRTASTSVPVAVATPLRCPRKLSATRSAVSMPRAGPAMTAMPIARFQPRAVGPLDADLDRGIDQAEGECRHVETGHDAGLARHQGGLGPRRRRHDRIGGEVAGAAEILQQRGTHGGFEQEGGKRGIVGTVMIRLQ